MNDRHTFTDHRMQAAQATGDRHAAQRGYVFDRMIEESPLWIRALSECFRIRSLIIFAVMGAVVFAWWL